MLALTYPWLILIFIITAFFFFVKKKWIKGFLLFLGGLILNCWSECIPFRFWPIKESCPNKTIKMLSFNMEGMDGNLAKKVAKIDKIIHEKAPDFIYLTEFCEQNVCSIDTLMRTKYPYSSKDLVNVGSHFYSKYPLGQLKTIKGKRDLHYMLSCELYLSNDTISLFGCHLTSNNYGVTGKYLTPDSLSGMVGILSYLNNVHNAYEERCFEAKTLAEIVNTKVHPVIMMGDFNDVGGSGAIRTLENCELKDAWWVGGYGYGATIHSPLPYRIDHIMYGESLNLHHIEVISSEGMSDHNMICAEFSTVQSH